MTLYQERNDEKRQQFAQSLRKIDPERIIYVDECGFDAPLTREFGYSPMGERLMGEKTGKRFNRTSIIAGLRQKEPVAPMRFEGYCNTEVVLSWVRQAFIPQLSTGDVVVWDNASFHKSPQLAEAFEMAGIQLLFLPPYSPDLNPIEQFWSELKAKIRLICYDAIHIAQAIDKVFSYFW
jgi:isftu1 transposase